MARDRSRAAYRAPTLQRRRTYCYSDPIGVLGVGWEELKRPTKPYCRPPLAHYSLVYSCGTLAGRDRTRTHDSDGVARSPPSP